MLTALCPVKAPWAIEGARRRYGRVSLFCALSSEARFCFILFNIIKNERIKKSKMKKNLTASISLSLALVLLLCLVSCNTVDAEGLWERATYRRDMTFGDGDTTVQLEVKVEDQSVTFTVNTDKKTLGDALIEHGLIEGEDGAYGLYVKKVNGIAADYDVDQSYWALYKNGEMSMTGVDTTEIADGEHYEFVYTK